MPDRTVPELTTNEPAPEEGELDFERVKQIATLLWRAPRRHPRMAVLSLLATLLAGLALAIFAPRSYECSSRILAQRNLMLPALDNPSRAVPREADSPTKDAADTILQRDNMVAMIKQLDLLDRWQSTRQPILRLKDKIWHAVFGPRSDDDRMLDMLGYLQKQLSVVASDSTITIEVQWPNRDLSYEIVDFLQKGFLEARFDSNVNVITEAIRILEERSKPGAAEVDAALADLTRLEAQRKGVAGEGRVAAPGADGGHRSWTPAPPRLQEPRRRRATTPAAARPRSSRTSGVASRLPRRTTTAS